MEYARFFELGRWLDGNQGQGGLLLLYSGSVIFFSGTRLQTDGKG
jgi:hypothetical protein